MMASHTGADLQLTQHTDIGLRVLILLGSVHPERLSSVELAERHGLSRTHVAKVVQSLHAGGFVQTQRGRAGGVSLARLPGDITVGEVVRALEPHLDLVECFQAGSSTCRFTGQCTLTHTLLRAKAAMLLELDRTNLGDLLAGMPRAAELAAVPSTSDP